ncbi:ATP-binding protein [Paraburkholderia sp.]|jgi:two-component system sensor histidine kinase QseC|uniref:ATP-binding protein n=1 Tax=Paraburkholderia sp. TaxID=1926495 RepID=UPI002F40DD00
MPVSIRRRLALLVLASIGVVWSAALGLSYMQATREVAEWDDARLVQLAQLLVRLDQNDLVLLARTHLDARDEYPHDGRVADDDDGDESPRDALFQVRDASGHVIAGSAALVPLGAWEPASGADGVTGAHNLRFDGQLWHTYTLHESTSGRTVRVLESANTRSDLTSDVARRIARPLAVALPVLALLVWVSIGHSLSPLQALSRVIRTRDASKLAPIELGPTPLEVRPLVEAINQLLARLRLSISRERAFTSDAAHELKTPLAAIKVQAQVALVAEDIVQQRLAMQRVVQGVDRSARLAEQLLLLARLDEHDRIPAGPVAPAVLAGDAIATHEQDARRKDIRIALAADAQVEVIAASALLDVLLDNLIDNAIKYADEGGRVEVEVRREGRAVVLAVRDDGPGVAAKDLARLTDRFFRAADAPASGSGLGLSIVARIAEHFGAQLHFGTGIEGRGLAVEIRFSRAISTPDEVASTVEI